MRRDTTCRWRQAGLADRSYRDGRLVQQDIPDIADHWESDSVAFLSELIRQREAETSRMLILL